MVEYGKTSPPSGQGSLNKFALAIAGIVVLLVALGARHCQGQKEQSTSNPGDERVKALEEKIKQLESRAKPELQSPAQTPKAQEVTTAPAISANDIDEYNRNISFQRGLVTIHHNSFQEFRSLGDIQSMQESANKGQKAGAMASCLERYRDAAEPFYKANTACLAETNNTPTRF